VRAGRGEHDAGRPDGQQADDGLELLHAVHRRQSP
jgi:hypothetical protein